MENLLRKHIADRIHLGDMAVFNELAVVPLIANETGGPDYITLKQAFAVGGFSVAEISEGGSVPNLKVINDTEKNVLMLDGEELAGSKQNRVLNTSILLPAGESRVIPVSCTEQGRWSYSSRQFSDSGVMMSRSIRSQKNLSVFSSLREQRSYCSDQGGVWDDIREFHRSHGTSSGTGAMKDAYEARRGDMESYQGHFPWQEGQCGMAVLIKGRVAGIEFLSLPGAYQQVHEKLLGSYVMDIPLARAGKSEPSAKKVQKIIERIMEAAEERYPSVGMGEDCRYTVQGLVGSALLCEGWYVHAAFFRNDRQSGRSDGGSERMSSMSRRRGYRSSGPQWVE